MRKSRRPLKEKKPEEMQIVIGTRGNIMTETEESNTNINLYTHP